jgi:hypothetical protein
VEIEKAGISTSTSTRSPCSPDASSWPPPPITTTSSSRSQRATPSFFFRAGSGGDDFEPADTHEGPSNSPPARAPALTGRGGEEAGKEDGSNRSTPATGSERGARPGEARWGGSRSTCREDDNQQKQEGMDEERRIGRGHVGDVASTKFFLKESPL